MSPFTPYIDLEHGMRIVRLYVAEQTPDMTLVYFAGGASAIMRTPDFNARYAVSRV